MSAGISALDNCEGSSIVNFDHEVISVTQDSQIIVNTWTTEDCLGNSNSHQQTVIYFPKQPALELTKESILQNSLDGGLTTAVGDTIFYNFEIANTGNSELINILLEDPIVEGVICDSISLQSGNTTSCKAYYIITPSDLNIGVVCNSAVVTAETTDGITARDTSDSRNAGDDTGSSSDNTYTHLDTKGEVQLFKYISDITDVNENGVTDPGDEVKYSFIIMNSGNISLYDLTIDDPLISVEGVLDSLGTGEVDSFTFMAIYTIEDTDGKNGFVENSATVFADLPDGIGGSVFDVSDAGDNNSETADAEGMSDGNPSNDPVVLCVVSPVVCPDPLIIPACYTPSQIDNMVQMWLDRFTGGGCGAEGRFSAPIVSPARCGETINVTFSLYLPNGDIVPNMSCTQSMSVVADATAPTCPTGWDIEVNPSDNTCKVDAYADMAELVAVTGVSNFDNCTPDLELVLTATDSLISEQCNAGGWFFDSRTVIRSYTMTDGCGNTSQLCPQEIIYNFNDCQGLTDYGRIGVLNSSSLEIPSGCIPPTIEVISPEQGVCGYVEYMWLSTTMVDANGNPITPTNLNIGSVWTLIEGENDAVLKLGAITEDTYYVRCARNFSCCDYGESNIVSIRINNSITCPVDNGGGAFVFEECDSLFNLISPMNNISNGDYMKYISDRVINAQNAVNQNSGLILDSKNSTLLNEGFEIQVGSELEVYPRRMP